MRRSTTALPQAKTPEQFTFDVLKPFYRHGRPVNPDDTKVKKDGVKMSDEVARFLVTNGTLKKRRTKAQASADKKSDGE